MTETLRALTDWIVAEGLADSGEDLLIDGLCGRLQAAGVPLERCNIGVDTLHPILLGTSFVWSAAEGLERHDYKHSDAEEVDRLWLSSPFHHLYSRDETWLRLRPGRQQDPALPHFPILDELAAAGATDYLVLLTPLSGGQRIGEFDTVYSSWTSHHPEGFSDEQVALIEGVLAPLCLALKSVLTRRITGTLMQTYLGVDAGLQVLEGRIARGVADSIQAVLWYSDLQGFTRIADTAPSEEVMGLLNDYAACVVEALRAHDGQVLKFIGDGILGIFELDGSGTACASAIAATDTMLAAVAELNENRRGRGLPTTEIYLALHLGEVLYGNVGSWDRLDFTVVGPAVNEVSRIVSLCRNLEQQVLISSDFAARVGSGDSRLVSLGRYALRGVSEPQELFTLDPESGPDPA